MAAFEDDPIGRELPLSDGESAESEHDRVKMMRKMLTLGVVIGLVVGLLLGLAISSKLFDGGESTPRPTRAHDASPAEQEELAAVREPESPAVVPGPDRGYFNTPDVKELASIGVASSAEGEALYRGKGGCAGCHGDSGRGDGPRATRIPGGVVDLIDDPKYLAASDQFAVIKYGSGKTETYHRANLTDQEVWNLIAYLDTLRGSG